MKNYFLKQEKLPGYVHQFCADSAPTKLTPTLVFRLRNLQYVVLYFQISTFLREIIILKTNLCGLCEVGWTSNREKHLFQVPKRFGMKFCDLKLMFGQKKTCFKKNDSLTDLYQGYSWCLWENGPLKAAFIQMCIKRGPLSGHPFSKLRFEKIIWSSILKTCF